MSRSGVNSIDTTTEAGARAEQRLGSERVAWMTTVKTDGTPQTSPIWFLWDGSTFLVYSLESARVTNIGGHMRVSLNLDGNKLGGDIVVVEGDAIVDRSQPSAAANAAYLEKYKPVMDDYGWTPEWFADRYSAAIVITPTKFRYW